MEKNILKTTKKTKKYYETLKKLQKDEACKRLEMLNLHPTVLKEFKHADTVYYSERQKSFFDGVLYWINNEDDYEQAIEEFEEDYHALVYHAQLTRLVYGTCLALLFVSQYPEEWEQERNDLKPDRDGIMHPYSYVCNLTDPNCSELGRIGIVRKNGGISRVY